MPPDTATRTRSPAVMSPSALMSLSTFRDRSIDRFYEQEAQFDDVHPEQPEPLLGDAALDVFPTENEHADIFFVGFLSPHFVQAGSSFLNTSNSNSFLHCSHIYSKMGICIPPYLFLRRLISLGNSEIRFSSSCRYLSTSSPAAAVDAARFA